MTAASRRPVRSDGVPEDLVLFDIPQLAEMWGTGEDWLRKGTQNRTLPFSMVAGQIRFTRAQAAEILAMSAVEVAKVPTRDQVANRRADAGRSGRKAA